MSFFTKNIVPLIPLVQLHRPPTRIDLKSEDLKEYEAIISQRRKSKKIQDVKDGKSSKTSVKERIGLKSASANS